MALTPAQEAQVLDLIAQQSALLSLAGVEATILSKLGATKVTLSDLPTASVIDDADLLLLRQGVTDKSVTGLTFKNLIPSTITTPPQFDNDTSIANTEFVQRALGNFSGYLATNTGSVLSPNTAPGKIVNMTAGAAAFTLTLPLTSSLPDGAAIFIQNTSGRDNAVARQGSDFISVDGSNETSVFIRTGEGASFVKAGAFWLMSGTAALFKSGSFGASLASNGYQKLPGGLIIQWGAVNAAVSPGTLVTFPISFTTSIYNVFTSTVSGNFSGSDLGSWSLSQARIANSGGATRTEWLAIGR